MDILGKIRKNEPEMYREVVFTGAEGGQDWAVCCWDLRSRAIKTSYKGNASKAQTLGLINNDYVVSADTCKPFLNIWALNRREPTLRIPSPGLVTALAVTADGMYCAVATAFKIYVWQVSTGESVAICDETRVLCLHFSRNSKFLLSGSNTGVRVWSMAKITNPNENVGTFGMECAYEFGHSKNVSSIKSSSTSVLTASYDQTVKLWSLSDGNLIRTFAMPFQVSAMEWSPMEDKAYAGMTDGSICEISTMSENADIQMFNYRKKQSEQTKKNREIRDKRVTCLSLSTDSRKLVSGTLKGMVCIWNTETRHLVTKLMLNSSGAITSCLIARMPTEFEKPVYPVAPFKLKQECEGRVKILLPNQKIDMKLNLEFNDDKFEKFVTKGVSMLHEYGQVDNKREHYAKQWTRLFEQLLSGLHDMLDQLYLHIETDSEKYQRPSSSQKLKPLQDSLPDFTSLIRTQFERLCSALSAMMSGLGLAFSAVVDFPLKYVIELFYRTMSVTSTQLLRKPTTQRLVLTSLLPFLHTATFGVLCDLIQCVKSAVQPHIQWINQVLSKSLRWSELSSAKDSEQKKHYCELRNKIFQAAEISILYGLSGDSKSFPDFFQAVICQAVTDARQKTDQPQLEARSEELLNTVNNAWLTKQKRKVKNRTVDVTADFVKPDVNSSSVNEAEYIAIKNLQANALKVLKRVIINEGHCLTKPSWELIVDLVRELYTNLEVCSGSDSSFYELVRVVVMALPSLPWQLQLPVEIYMPKIINDQTEEIRLLATLLRRQGFKFSEVSNNTDGLSSLFGSRKQVENGPSSSDTSALFNLPKWQSNEVEKTMFAGVELLESRKNQANSCAIVENLQNISLPVVTDGKRKQSENVDVTDIPQESEMKKAKYDQGETSVSVACDPVSHSVEEPESIQAMEPELIEAIEPESIEVMEEKKAEQDGLTGVEPIILPVPSPLPVLSVQRSLPKPEQKTSEVLMMDIDFGNVSDAVKEQMLLLDSDSENEKDQ